MYCVTVLEVRIPKSRCQQCHAPSKVCREEKPLALSEAAELLGVLGIPWPTDGSPQPLPPSLGAGLSLCVCCPHRAVCL